MKTVYRVQNQNNYGPYQSGAKGDWYWEMVSEHRGFEHPNGSQDDIWSRGGTSEHLFGFSSLDNLFEWFDGYVMNLIDANFIIAKYEVDEYIEGVSKRQVVFIPTTFEDITSFAISKLYQYHD